MKMKILTQKFLAGVVTVCALWGAPVAVSFANPVPGPTAIVTDNWYVFNFGNDGEQFAPCVGEQCDLFGYGTPSPPWTITLASAATLIFADAFQSGDRFEISVTNVTTSVTTPYSVLPSLSTVEEGASCFTAVDCLLNTKFDRIVVPLLAGSYEISGIVLYSPFDSGAGFFSLQTKYPVLVSDPDPPEPLPAGNPFPIPEPASLALLGLGLLIVWGIRRTSSIVKRANEQVLHQQ
jgi:hypothetical protein